MNKSVVMQKRAPKTDRTWSGAERSLMAAVMGVCMVLSSPLQAVNNVGTGGTVTYTDATGLNPAGTPYADGYVVHTFTTTGTTNFTVPAVAGSLDIEYLLVGGGGSGGSAYGGGGGAGGLRTNQGGTPKSVAAGTYTVVIGAGGAGVSVAGLGKTGTVSSAFGLTALGGGAGGGNSDGGGGGSGGGAARNATSFPGGLGTPEQGNDGGHATVNTGGAGGGGAGAAGGSVTAKDTGGAGGIGLQNSLSGTTNWYAAGGSGVYNNTSASGIGGKCQSGVAAGAGMANTGSGGGANTATGSGAGGSGVVILRYRYVAEMPLLVRVTAPANNKGFYQGTSIMTTALVTNDAAPYTVTFFTNYNSGAFAQAGEPVSAEPYALDLDKLPAGTYGIYAVATNASGTATSPTNSFTVATTNVATGGTITYTDSSGLNPRSSPPWNPGYVVHTFTTVGTNTLTLPGVADGLNVDYLIVGGGGSGGNSYGGGGGAGGLRTNLGGTPLTVSAGSYEIVVGAGGAGVNASSIGNSGNASAAFSLKVNGGGGGGGNSVAGSPGGSGGGSSGSTGLPGPGNLGYGNRGGPASTASTASGGGGAGGVGGSAASSGGYGGAGLQSSISGLNAWYAAGGSGVLNATSANSIGGNSVINSNGGAGVVNTGAGGGANAKTGGTSGAGGTGIVIVRYAYVYESGETVALPLFSPTAGGYIGAQNVTLSCTTPDSVIHYTTDGTTPTGGSPVYTNVVTLITIPLDTAMTVKAIGVKTGYASSEVASAAYITGSSGTWTSTAGGSWSVPANWTNGIVGQGRGIPVKFDTLKLAANVTNTLDGARTVGSLAFADVGNLYDWTLNTGIPGSVSLTLDAATTSEISVSNRTATLGVVVAGTNGLSKTGDGTLVLHEVNTFSGGVSISGGTLDWQNVPNSSAGTVTVNAGCTAKFHGTYLNYGYTVANALVGAGSVTAKSGLGTGVPGHNTGYVTFSGDLSGFTGTLTFDTTLNYGVLGVSANADGSRAKWVVNRTGGSYYLSVNQVGTYKLGELSGNGALGAYYLSGTTTWEVGALGTDSTFEGVIENAVSPNAGLAALKKVGAGKLTLTNNACVYGGGTVVSNGVLEVGVNGSLGTNTVEVTGGKLSLLGSSAISDTAQLRLPDATDKLELATGVNETVGELYIGGEPAWRGTWGRIGNTASWHKSAAITGDGILTVTGGPKKIEGTMIRFF